MQREFPGLAEQVPAARAWVLACLPSGCPRAADVALVLTELVTNAVIHSASGAPGGSFRVQVEVTPGAVTLAVIDQGPALVPVPREPDESGWGLACIVGDLADGYEVIDDSAGRTVWCLLEWSPAP
ncbi:hypothetical protein GCM10010156_64950 [Planobispora rosea]|uniref:Histidine kinase/HSP90-like ATPase domain-containing protein n=2 Tax=Planobispora rosea TaxID=35762 RepID=A0A8J3WHG5_PLARO|nr:hypothetical protein GCM10010156_64950 [Planobispora rosea]GIH87826.1 hypothetical protein Pro02_62340 [Planobispora rosea]